MIYASLSLFIVAETLDRNSEKWDRHLEAGDDAEAMEEHGLLTYPLCLFSLLSYRTQDRLPRDGPTSYGLGPLTAITNENVRQACLQLDLIVPLSQLRIHPL